MKYLVMICTLFLVSMAGFAQGHSGEHGHQGAVINRNEVHETRIYSEQQPRHAMSNHGYEVSSVAHMAPRGRYYEHGRMVSETARTRTVVRTNNYPTYANRHRKHKKEYYRHSTTHTRIEQH